MKNIINIGGGLLLVWFLLRKKEENAPVIDDILPEILVPETPEPAEPEVAGVDASGGLDNRAYSPTATTNVVSELQALEYAIQGINLGATDYVPPVVPGQTKK